MQTFFHEILFKSHYKFRSGFNTQHCLISMTEKGKGSVDNGGAFGGLMTDLSKAFDCLHHELLTTKPGEDGYDLK